MAVFELILCIIAAVVLSSFLSRFIPKVSTPLVQIALGALASQLPFFPDVTLSPELFIGVVHRAAAVFGSATKSINRNCSNR